MVCIPYLLHNIINIHHYLLGYKIILVGSQGQSWHQMAALAVLRWNLAKMVRVYVCAFLFKWDWTMPASFRDELRPVMKYRYRKSTTCLQQKTQNNINKINQLVPLSWISLCNDEKPITSNSRSQKIISILTTMSLLAIMATEMK